MHQGYVQLSDINSRFTDEVHKLGGETLNLCIQCGTCTASCPSGRVAALRTRKLIRKAQLGLEDEIFFTDDLWQCTTCYRCYERCPRGVEVPDIIIILRNIAVKKGDLAEAHQKNASYIVSTGHLIPFREKEKALRVKVGLDPIPPTTLSSEKALEEIKAIAKKTGFDKLILGSDKSIKKEESK